MEDVLDVIVIGAGQAGLGVSFLLKKSNINHLVLEKGEIGESWLKQRWDSFRMVTPNKFNHLPGLDDYFSNPDGFCSGKEFAAYLKFYAKQLKLPIQEYSDVTKLKRNSHNQIFSIEASINNSLKSFSAKQVIIASGILNKKKTSNLSKNVSPKIYQLHSCEYKNHNTLPEGGVLIIGSGQSGMQITDDLIQDKRKVFLSTSKVGRIPRRYRGEDIEDWLVKLNFYETETSSITNLEELNQRQPHLSGSGLFGKTLSFQQLEREGVLLLGSTKSIDGFNIHLNDDLIDHIGCADNFSNRIKSMIDKYTKKHLIDTAHEKIDLADVDADLNANRPLIEHINLLKEGISSIIWATGFKGNFDYIKFPIFDNTDNIIHKQGVSNIPGLYYLGFPWLRKSKSGMIMGVREDAKYIVKEIIKHLS